MRSILTTLLLLVATACLAHTVGSSEALAAPPPQADDPATARATPPRPEIRKLGTLDLDLVEATPVVFNDRLHRFEYVRKDYKANTTGDTYFRFIDVETGAATPPFARGYDLGCAHVEGGAMWVFGVDQ